LPFVFWKITQIGWVGVNLFFVLSGFLISRILIHQKNEPHYFKRFYKKRALRILPLYLLTLVFIFFHYEHSGKFVLTSLLFLAHIPNAFGIVPCYPGLWSLSIEEQFYLFWPQVIRRVTFSHIRKVSYFLCLVSPLIRGLAFYRPDLLTLCMLLGGFDGFAYGAILALQNEKTSSEKLNLKTFSLRCVLVGILMIIVGFKFGILTRQRVVGEMFLPSLIYLFSTSFMAYCIAESGRNHLRILAKGFLPQWGKLSYGAYLCHYPIPEYVGKIFSFYPKIWDHFFSFWFSCAYFGLSLLGTYLVALILHHFIELPFLRMKSTFSAEAQSDYPQKVTTGISSLEC
jgi:peptidoglycan/LPS O-acetylase OafA/YrhL